MGHQDVGEKEKQLRLLREQRLNRNGKKVSSTDLRKKIAAVKPMAKNQGGRRGR